MRMPRITIRTLMIIVAVVALIFTAAPLVRLSFAYSKQAAAWAKEESRWKLAEAAHDHPPVMLAGKPAECSDLVEYYRALKTKYEHAARYPWLHIEPDPPGPEVYAP